MFAVTPQIFMNPDQAADGSLTGAAPATLKQQKWSEDIVTKFVGNFEAITNVRLQDAIAKALSLSSQDIDVEADSKFRGFINSLLDQDTFNLEKIALTIASIEAAGDRYAKSERDKAQVVKAMDLLMPLLISPITRDEFAKTLCTRDISETSFCFIGARLVLDAVSPSAHTRFALAGDATIRAANELKLVLPAIGDPNPRVIACEILKDLYGQMYCLDYDDDEENVEAMAAKFCKALGNKIHFCISSGPALGSIANAVQIIQKLVPNFIFFQANRRSADKAGEEVVLQILKDRIRVELDKDDF